MKGIINFSARNKFAIWSLTIIVSFGGLYSGLTMKQETIPDINVPFLSVTAIYPGATLKVLWRMSPNRSKRDSAILTASKP